jgi:hypothetical protein
MMQRIWRDCKNTKRTVLRPPVELSAKTVEFISSANFSLISLPVSQYFLFNHYRGYPRLTSLSLDACLNSPHQMTSHRKRLAEVVSQLRTELVSSFRSVMNDRRAGPRNAYFCSKISRYSSRLWLQFLFGIQKYYLKPKPFRNYANKKIASTVTVPKKGEK